MDKLKIVTTSWDDGDSSDLKVAELLRSKGVRGTFYIPIMPYRAQPLSPAELKSLSSEGFEIGAHGYSHKLLHGLSRRELASEIGPCKPILEDILGNEVRMFCYPGGRYDKNVVRALKEAGYIGARTVRMLATRLECSPFEVPTTVQIFPHRATAYIRNLARTRTIEGLQNCLANKSWLGNWFGLAKSMFDFVLDHGGIWHLFGHSWELDQLQLWGDLDKILDYVAQQKDVTYVSNGELLSLLLAANPQASRN